MQTEGWTDRQTDRYGEANSRFSQFCECSCQTVPCPHIPSALSSNHKLTYHPLYAVLHFILISSYKYFAFQTMNSNRTMSLRCNKSGLLSEVALVDFRGQLFCIDLGLRSDFAEKFCLLSSFFSSPPSLSFFLLFSFLYALISFFSSLPSFSCVAILLYFLSDSNLFVSRLLYLLT
jgi:hypothetical protein